MLKSIKQVHSCVPPTTAGFMESGHHTNLSYLFIALYWISVQLVKRHKIEFCIPEFLYDLKTAELIDFTTILMTCHFQSWKATSNKISCNRINLLTCIGDRVVTIRNSRGDDKFFWTLKWSARLFWWHNHWRSAWI